MKRKLLFTMLLLFVTLLVPLSLFSQSRDFDMGTVLVKYNGTAANVTIPSSVTMIGNYAFSFCSSLRSITIPSSVTHIGDGAFSWCESLASITIPSSVTSIGEGAFLGCSSLSAITVDIQNSEYSSRNGVLFHKSLPILIQYPAGKQERNYTIPSSVGTIGAYAFSNSGLTSITIPAGVSNIEDGAFAWCESLTSITIPSSVTYIGDRAFAGCSSLTSITIPSSVTYIGYGAFDRCVLPAAVRNDIIRRFGEHPFFVTVW